MKYIVIIEKSENNYSAYVPDLPGCVTTGDDIAEIEQNMKEAISGHLAIMEEFGDPLPNPFHRLDLRNPETTILQVFIPELAIV